MNHKESEPLPIVIPQTYNYIGVWLTFACSLKCSYCTNRHETKTLAPGHMSGKDWVRALTELLRAMICRLPSAAANRLCIRIFITSLIISSRS